MEPFFGREKEKELLQNIYDSDRAELVAIYGRRRVGKTYLVREFFKNKGIYFEVTGNKGASLKEQLRNFVYEFNSLFTEWKIEVIPKDWGEAFHLLKEVLIKLAPDQRVVFFIDELPWIASPKSGFLRALGYLWNRHLSGMPNIKVILCGSAAAWMIRNVIQDKGGLHNRLSASIRLEPFSLSEVEDLLRAKGVRFDRKQLITLYMAVGGIPKYLDFIKPGKSVAQLINDLFFHPQGFLFQEFPKLYSSLFDHSERHTKIISALAAKKSGLLQSELFEIAGLKLGGTTTTILMELEECGFISGIPEYGKKRREKKWRLIDEYSLFYLQWVQEMRDTILRGGDADYWLKLQNSSKFLSWAGYAFENICLKHVDKIKKALGIGSVSTTETQWASRGNNIGAQIDLVIDRADHCINLCEIKFSNDEYLFAKQDQEDLERKKLVFQQETQSRKTLFTTMICPYGVKVNEYYLGTVQSQLTMDALF